LNQQKIKHLTAFLLFLVVFLVYALTSSNTINFWDSPEFAISNYKLQSTHPPGAPFYTLITNTINFIIPQAFIVQTSNLISGIFGALTCVFVFYIVYFISEKINPSQQLLSKIIPGIISALAIAFTHSFWIASTETEVYTLSFALITAMIYCMLLWYNSKTQELKLLILLSFLLGISTGVHLISLSIVIPFTILFISKKYGTNLKHLSIGLILGCICFFILHLFIFQGTLVFLSKLDIFFVNSFQFSLNYGALLGLIFIAILLLFIVFFSHKKKLAILHQVSLMIVFFLVGCSSYIMPILRSEAPISNGVSNTVQLLDYVKAKQFGVNKIPLLTGYNYNAPLDNIKPFLDADPTLVYDTTSKKYITTNDGTYETPNYAREFKTLFPRMHDQKNSSSSLYESWATIKGEPIEYVVNGKKEILKKPTSKENLDFFFNYQASWLYLRYLYWNFIGKQNNHHGLGNIKNGNWASGIELFDKYRIGTLENTPNHYKTNKGNSTFFFIPFLLGLLGIFALSKQKALLYFTLLLFLILGIGITIYVNPTPSSILIRERDYIFIGSFIIFCIWIGLSFHTLQNLLKTTKKAKSHALILGVIIILLAPIQMLAKGWNDHQRSDNYFAYDLAKTYLDGCPKNAILITNGDNMTFPLWYLQEVEAYRTDIRVINYDQLNLDWYIDKLKTKVNTSEPIKIDLNKTNYIAGAERLFPFRQDTNNHVDLNLIFDFLNEESTKITWNGKQQHYIPTSKFSFTIDTTSLKYKSLFDTSKLRAQYTNTMNWEFQKDFFALNDVVTYNIIKNNFNQRPICFTINGKNNHQLGLENYFIQRGLVHILAPLNRINPQLNPKIIDTETSLKSFMNPELFSDVNVNESYIDPLNQNYTQDILRRSHYFLAQGLIEEQNFTKAKEVLDTTFSKFPNTTIPYRQFAFALGKLYYRLNDAETGNAICNQAITNFYEELKWMISFNPPNPTINIRHSNTLKNMLNQMVNQLSITSPQLAKEWQSKLEILNTQIKTWQQKNWPY
jgi:hypothetical protein